jgi:hypothetical protein
LAPFLHTFTATGTYTTLAALYDSALGNDPGTTKYLGFKGTLTAGKANGGNLLIKHSSTGVEQSLEAQEYFTVDGTNIANILIKGNGYTLKVFGVSAKGW